MDITEFARLGGQARAKKLSASRRQEIARNAVAKRWGILASKQSPVVDDKPSIDIGDCKYCTFPETLCKRRKRDHTFTPYRD